jgi:peptidoglycan/xylan/chitin deacetylase (PgdA/CDA1 family)
VAQDPTIAERPGARELSWPLMASSAVVTTAAVSYLEPAARAITPFRRRLFPGLSGYGDVGHVALTFDDGPDPVSTPHLLNLLAERNVHATFFMLGSMAAAAPGLARARDTVAGTTRQVPAWFRPPYGILTAGALAAARRLELRPLLWTSCGREWKRGATSASVLTTLLRTLDGGGTVLLHDSDQQARPGSARAARAALPTLLTECARRGLTAGTVAQHGLD